MRRKLAAVTAVLCLTGVAMAASVPSAGASFHLMKIRAVFLGPVDGTAFIELQMTADGQNFVGGHTLKVYNANATTASTFIIPANVANGQNQRTVLIGDPGQASSPDFTFALRTSLAAHAAAGAACFDTVDCVSWGNFTGAGLLPDVTGTPIPGGLSTMLPAVRTIARGCATALDDPDDSGNSAADFAFGFFTPRNNAATPTEVLCQTPTPTTTPKKKRKCKKKKKKRGAASAKKKRCKKKKKR